MRLAIVGLGKMGQSILKGLLEAGFLPPEAVGVLDRSPELTEARARAFGVRPLTLMDLKRVARDLAHPGVGYLSIMAGVSTRRIAAALGTRRVVRAMPNLAATIKKSTTVLTALPEARDAGDLAFAEGLFATVGSVHPLDEALFDAFTAMSASAPAYLALVAEALADGGVRMGIPREAALRFAAEVLEATGALLSAKHPALLKDEVASPAGTTIYGLKEIEEAGVRGALIRAVAAATARGRALGEEE